MPTACVMRELPTRLDPASAFERLRATAYPWLLESSLRVPRLGRYSFVGADPYLVMRARGRRIDLECRRSVHPSFAPGRSQLEGDPLEIARRILPDPPVTAAPAVPFCGGAVGYFGYELAGATDAVEHHPRDDLGRPDLVLLFVDSILAIDHETDRAWTSALGFAADEAAARSRAESSLRRLTSALAAPVRRVPFESIRPASIGTCNADPDPSIHAQHVDAVKREIVAGNVYQACLTYRMERRFSGDPWHVYRRLRRLNPAPFSAYLELPELQIASSSPERFLNLGIDGSAESRPIKGTRPRGRDAAEDAALERELVTSPKERAENLMIVDLVRNDLGRVCELGSIDVPELMVTERYASVLQLVSSVRGRLRTDRDVFDLIRAAFPPGSMTGAPKIAAMRILDRLESARRTVYSGALGYLDVHGRADLSVVIRTLLMRGDRAHVHVGGGIVADSSPTEEYRETRAKARLLLAALESDRPVTARPEPDPLGYAGRLDGGSTWDL